MVQQIKERKQRFFNEIIDVNQIFQLLKTECKNKKLILKYDALDRKIEINELIDNDKSVMIVTPEDYEPVTEDSIIASILIEKYYEIQFKAIEKKGLGYYKCKIEGARVATSSRADLRFKVKENDAVATNFRASKHAIEVTTLNIPTGIKVIFDQFENKNRANYDHIEIGYFKNMDIVTENIKKTGKALFVTDLMDLAAYKPPSDDFIDLNEVLGVDFEQYIHKLKEKGFKSIMIVPVMYITDAELLLPFAYIKVLSKEKTFSIENVLTIKEDTFNLVDRIRDANTVLIPERQGIINISRGGVRLRIINDELKKYLIRAKGFVFDIVFKLQAPITIYGEIKYTGKDIDNNLILGLSFAGNSSRKNEMKRLYSILEPMELEYKKQLIKKIKDKKELGL